VNGTWQKVNRELTNSKPFHFYGIPLTVEGNILNISVYFVDKINVKLE
jgi:hypothetical protein